MALASILAAEEISRSAEFFRPIRFSSGVQLGFNLATLAPIGLLLASSLFMTFAWYGHLKFPGAALWVVVLASWGIAFFEYWLAVPANRIG